MVPWWLHHFDLTFSVQPDVGVTAKWLSIIFHDCFRNAKSLYNVDLNELRQGLTDEIVNWIPQPTWEIGYCCKDIFVSSSHDCFKGIYRMNPPCREGPRLCCWYKNFEGWSINCHDTDILGIFSQNLYILQSSQASSTLFSLHLELSVTLVRSTCLTASDSWLVVFIVLFCI